MQHQPGNACMQVTIHRRSPLQRARCASPKQCSVSTAFVQSQSIGPLPKLNAPEESILVWSIVRVRQ